MYPKQNPVIINEIRDWMLARYGRQRKLADLLGVQPHAVYRWFVRQRCNPPPTAVPLILANQRAIEMDERTNQRPPKTK